MPLLLPLFLCHISHSSVSRTSSLFPIELPTLLRTSHPVKRRSSFSFSLLQGRARGDFQLEREERRGEAKCEEGFKRMTMRGMEVSFDLMRSFDLTHTCCGSQPQDHGVELRFVHPKIFHLWLLCTLHRLLLCRDGIDRTGSVITHTVLGATWERCYRCQIAAVGIYSVSITLLHNTNPTSAQNLQSPHVAMATAAVPTCYFTYLRR